MRYLMILTLGVSLLFGSLPAMADQADDETAIRDVIKKINDAWNRHDVPAVVANFSKDWENWEGTWKGSATLEKEMAAVHERQPKHERKLLDEIGIVFISPSVAIYRGHVESINWIDENGKTLPTAKQRFARVFRKENGKWLAVASFRTRVDE